MKYEANRLGLFSFYDRDGIVDEYITYLLTSLSECLSHLIIIVNGYIDTNGMNAFKKFTDEIYIRENEGFDGGAYKDIILNEIGRDRLLEYDELVLCNDTFYGPFKPFKTIFEEMYLRSCDFWGLNYVENKISNHIQSYFLVFRKNIIQNDKLSTYFISNINSKAKRISDIYADFEFGLFYYLINKGCTFNAYVEKSKYELYKSCNLFLRKYNFPILKKRAFSPQKQELLNIIDALQYINKICEYDVNMILNNAKRTYNFSLNLNDILNYRINETDLKTCYFDIATIDEREIIDLIKDKERIYIYGAGSFAGKISRILYYNNVTIEGYIVSDDQNIASGSLNKKPVYKFSDITLADDSTVIVALDKKNTEMVKKYLVDIKNVIYLW